MEKQSPFDDPQQPSLVLCNHEAQYSLWFDANAIPNGWTVAFGPATRTQCDEWLAQHWPDIRPLSSGHALNR
ncbi:MbtH protein [Gibbsiella quercinecans]|uniref:Antibiotic synthesis protein MbtH n=1 Tax=Gibbsiella quercinecans TaxID=929813 RepID=A0A250B4T9_9GAMM|nr:MbtH family protein [Gibbsiella quercinecans]ATA21253.1 antibiotic synthesis protein MbtH [Gibbsiella quercinecans]RLM07369.1 antibiotic synthesis protein MbtH [Gibbsiella quercinecans]RLM13424.1 antibiotic synthesis protein MbtH [Gibbsiella quercinecans]TCT88480.1 MbtH protein [Gibbsiella quercinecans]